MKQAKSSSSGTLKHGISVMAKVWWSFSAGGLSVGRPTQDRQQPNDH